MEQNLLKNLAGKTADEKILLLTAWAESGLIDADMAGEMTAKIEQRQNQKQRQLQQIKEFEKDVHAFDALFKTSTSVAKEMALEKLQQILRLKRKAYLTDRYFNAELSPAERKALNLTLLVPPELYPIQIGDILIEVLKYPVKPVKMQGNAYLDKLLEEGVIDISFWIRLLNRKYVAKRQWQQLIKYADRFKIYAGGAIITPYIKEWAERGDPGAVETLKAYQ